MKLRRGTAHGFVCLSAAEIFVLGCQYDGAPVCIKRSWSRAFRFSTPSRIAVGQCTISNFGLLHPGGAFTSCWKASCFRGSNLMTYGTTTAVHSLDGQTLQSFTVMTNSDLHDMLLTRSMPICTVTSAACGIASGTTIIRCWSKAALC